MERHGGQFIVASFNTVDDAVNPGTRGELRVLFDRFGGPWLICTACESRFDPTTTNSTASATR